MKERVIIWITIIIEVIALIFGAILIYECGKELAINNSFNALGLILLPLVEVYGIWQVIILLIKIFNSHNK